MVRLILALALLGAGAAAALAETYPSKPVRVVAPFPAGGPLDLAGRPVLDRMAAALGQAFVYDVKPGAGGNIGSDIVAKAEPDGYTLLVTIDTPVTVNPSVYPSMPFDAARDLVPVAGLAGLSQMLVVHESVAARTLPEFIAWAKREKPNYASGGNGSPGHLAFEMLAQSVGIAGLTHVPYRGNAPAVGDVVAGQVPTGFLASTGVMPHVKSGKLRALAFAGLQRSQLAPEIPTIGELGHPGLEAVTMVLLMAPAGTPEPILARLEQAALAAVQAPELAERWRAADIALLPLDRKAAAARLAADAQKWAKVVKAAKIRLD